MSPCADLSIVDVYLSVCLPFNCQLETRHEGCQADHSEYVLMMVWGRFTFVYGHDPKKNILTLVKGQFLFSFVIVMLSSLRFI